MDLGLHTTLTDANSKLDPEVIAISERITPLQGKEFGKVWDLFTVRARPFETDEYEILTRDYTAPEVTVTATGSSADWDTNNDTTALPVSSATISRITIGDVLRVGSEIVVVKSVDTSGNTIDVYERGAGSSTAVAHGTSAITAKIIGNAHEEGKVQSVAMAEQTSKLTNYCQLVQEIVDLSKADSDQARKTGRTEDTLKAEAMERVQRDLARTAIYGVARAGTSTIPAMTRGLISHLEDVTGALKTNVSGAFTETALKNILDDVRSAGGSVNAIVMSVANKRVFNTFTGADATQFTVDGQTKNGGLVIDGYLADGFGTIPAVVDTDMPDDYVAVVDSRHLTKGWKVNDQLRFVVEPNTNSRERKENLQGKFGLAIDAIGKSHGLLTGLTT